MSNDSIGLEDFDSGSKAWKAEKIGDKIVGRVISARKGQATDFATGKPKTWEDGNPVIQYLVEVETDDRRDDDDDGKRTIYLKGGNFKVAEGSGQSGIEALKAAIAESGVNCGPNATIKVAHTGLAELTNPRYQPAKLYTIKLEAPVEAIAADDLWDD